ncbi:MAG TPA: ParA family partition ATPase [Labilithrix sp.]|nr:ParA family partition ATPase [Labilithrix sp.]
MIVALTGQKGGVGKSTTAICLAMVALERGARVLLVDADPQGTTRTWAEVAAENGRPTPSVVAMGPTMHVRGQLRNVAAGFDITFIDCPPRHGEVQRSALMVADLAVLPCGPSAADAWALAASLETLAEARSLREELSACILITRRQNRTSLGRGARKVLESAPLPVLATELGFRVAYQEALAAGQGITGYAPRDPASREITSLYDELEAMFHGQEARSGFVAQAANT